MNEGRMIRYLFAVVCTLYLTLKPITGTLHSFINVVTDRLEAYPDGQTMELSLLMDVLDRQYTPHCLRVVIASDVLYNSYNSSSIKKRPAFSSSSSFQPSLRYSEKIGDPAIIDETKPNMKLYRSVNDIKSVLEYISTYTDKVNYFACVTYMLPQPPDAGLLSLLTDPTSSKRLTRYFLVYAETSTEAEQFLLDQRLRKEENVAALVQEESEGRIVWSVLIRQLLHPSGSPQVLTVNMWSRDTGLDSTDNIFPEQMANFYGQKLIGSTMDYIPFIDTEKTEGSWIVKLKPCVDLYLINAIANTLNFTYDMVWPKDGQWGFINDKGHYVGVLGEVEFGRANFALDLSVTLERAQHVDFTDYYFTDGITFITAKSRPDPLWRKLITPLRTSVWVCVVVSVGVGALLYHAIYRVQATLTSSRLLSSNAFMDIFASFLSQSLHRYLVLQAGKVFLGFWFLYAFLVTSYYKTSLTSTLAVPFKPSTINTLQELLQSGLSYGMQIQKGAAYSLFALSTVPFYQNMFQQMTFHTTADNMQKVAEEQYSYIYFKSNLELLVAMYNDDPRRKTDIHVAKEDIFTVGYACAVPQGDPYRRTFNAVMKRCNYAGLINKWIRDALPLFLKKPEQKKGEGEDEAPGDASVEAEGNSRGTVFSVNHLQGAFFVLFLGTVGGLLLLLLELLFGRNREV